MDQSQGILYHLRVWIEPETRAAARELLAAIGLATRDSRSGLPIWIIERNDRIAAPIDTALHQLLADEELQSVCHITNVRKVLEIAAFVDMERLANGSVQLSAATLRQSAHHGVNIQIVFYPCYPDACDTPACTSR